MGLNRVFLSKYYLKKDNTVDQKIKIYSEADQGMKVKDDPPCHIRETGVGHTNTLLESELLLSEAVRCIQSLPCVRSEYLASGRALSAVCQSSDDCRL